MDAYTTVPWSQPAQPGPRVSFRSLRSADRCRARSRAQPAAPLPPPDPSVYKPGTVCFCIR
eukprot:3065155-Prymnesium_polylepis.1